MRSLPDIVFKRTSRITSLTAPLLLQSYVSAHSILSHVCSKISSRSLQIIIWQCLASLSYSIKDIFSKQTPFSTGISEDIPSRFDTNWSQIETSSMSTRHTQIADSIKLNLSVLNCSVVQWMQKLQSWY